jgi:Trk-type K+ transport system membrane component
MTIPILIIIAVFCGGTAFGICLKCIIDMEMGKK